MIIFIFIQNIDFSELIKTLLKNMIWFMTKKVIFSLYIYIFDAS